MKSRFAVCASFTLIVLMACCSPALSAGNASFDLKKARTEIEEVNRRYCEVLRKGDAAGLATFFTEDAKAQKRGAIGKKRKTVKC